MPSRLDNLATRSCKTWGYVPGGRAVAIIDIDEDTTAYTMPGDVVSA
jgi:hypothetical protein